MQFTDEQLRAIDIARLGQNACIVAGPGSGKTTVLVERYRQLVASGIEPSEILAITFTEKAAANMRSRLAREFAQEPPILRKLERASVSTIHAFCSRLLKENATAAGVDPEFEILDEQLSVLEQRKALRDALDDVFHENAEGMRRLFDATADADLQFHLPGIYDGMRSGGVRPADLRCYPKHQPPKLEYILATADRYLNGFPLSLTAAQKRAKEEAKEWKERVISARDPLQLIPHLLDKKGLNISVNNAAKEEVKAMRPDAESLAAYYLDEAFAREKDLLTEILERFDFLYNQRKADRAALDFNDLEYFTVRLLRDNAELKQQVNQHFRLVMTDEFQDTSRQQSELLRLLHAPGRFYAVGDLNQSIYSFRHASPVVFEEYRATVQSSGAHHQELRENWRSREPILLATQFVLRDAPGITERDLIPARQFPPKSEPSIEVMVFEDSPEADDYDLEARGIANRIAELQGTLRLGAEARPARLSDFAILVRNTSVLPSFVAALDRAGLDYNLNRRTGFFETPEARQLLHLLHAIHNPRDETSTLAVLRSDLAGISDEDILRLKLHGKTFGAAFNQLTSIPLSEEDRQRLERFTTAFAYWRSAASYLSVDRLILRALDDMGFPWDPRSLAGANIEKFLQIARANANMTLAEFVAHLDALRDADPREMDSPLDDALDAIQIMTTHAAKGLEFPVVFLATLDKGVDSQRSPVLNFTPEFGLGVKWTLDPAKDPDSGFVHNLNKGRLKDIDTGEANRLLYVAMTRAEEHLVLSWTRTAPQDKPGNWAKTVAAAFNLETIAPTAEPSQSTFHAPDGKSFEARIWCANALPPLDGSRSRSARFYDTLVLDLVSAEPAWEPNTTATALSLFASCPRKFYLGPYLGWRGDLVRARAFDTPPAASESRASDIGTQVHALLAGSNPAPLDLESIRLAQVFERSSLGKRSYKARRRETEWDFIFFHQELILRGTIDLWFEDAGGLTLVDYKTDEVTAEQASLRAEDYRLQLNVYALALQRAFGVLPKAAWLHFLKPDIAVPISVNNAEEELARVIADYIDAQQTQQFPLHVGAHCRRCEFYRTLCPAKLDRVPE